ncbi:MAG: hypothetical protein PF450_05865 [Bacteroidales bacterium]|jgi:hypothetical protein|nr:hypothetical protein [Bacteroidales bacterium]
MKKIFLVLIIILLSASCDNVVGNFISNMWSETTYAIGDTGPSGVGIVFYITDGGLHGLEVAPENQDGSTYWSIVDDVFAYGASALPDEIGAGSTNTGHIIDQSTDSMAQICRNYRKDEEGDWFMPSKNELNAIWDNLVDDGNGNNNGVGNFDDYSYLSSSEMGPAMVSGQSFSDGGQYGHAKDASRRVRAVRAF